MDAWMSGPMVMECAVVARAGASDRLYKSCSGDNACDGGKSILVAAADNSITVAPACQHYQDEVVDVVEIED